MSNSLTDSIDRYIVIGIDENKETKEKTVFDVSKDKNYKTSEDIIQNLRNYMQVLPHIEIVRKVIDDSHIDIIKITPHVRDLPYVLSNKNCCYQDDKNKTHTIQKNWIYSRQGSRNTGVCELCTMPILEELFARKRGEHLPTIDRFSMYLDDPNCWIRPKTAGTFSHPGISEDCYYYKKNHQFKITRHDAGDNYRSMQKKEHVHCYQRLVADTGLGEDYWNYRLGQLSCHNDFYSWFNVELCSNNTIIDILEIMEIDFNCYFADKEINLPGHFYFPPRNYISMSDLRTKEQVQNSFVWKVCKMMTEQEYAKYTSDAHYDDLDGLLDLINWDYIQNSVEYTNSKNDYIWKVPDDLR